MNGKQAPSLDSSMRTGASQAGVTAAERGMYEQKSVFGSTATPWQRGVGVGCVVAGAVQGVTGVVTTYLSYLFRPGQSDVVLLVLGSARTPLPRACVCQATAMWAWETNGHMADLRRVVSMHAFGTLLCCTLAGLAHTMTGGLQGGPFGPYVAQVLVCPYSCRQVGAHLGL